MTTATAQPRVLLIGLAPEAVDFSKFPDMTPAKLAAGLQATLDEVRAAGLDAAWCLTATDPATAVPAIAAHLRAHPHDAVMIGAGVRTNPDTLELFEQILNLVHAEAPTARICFNTRPDTTLAALRRWLPAA